MVNPFLRRSSLFALLCFASLGVTFPCAMFAKDSWIEVTTPNFKIVSNAGEGQARKIAGQFEQFREMFHNAFPKFRVDLGRPLLIFAVKNEDTLKILLPGYWEVKGRVHPAGIFVPGETQHFVAVRMDIAGDNPYEVVYHEYTHAIMNVNVQSLPVWLGEGLAEYFGASVIHEKEVDIGRLSAPLLLEMQRGRLIPVDELMLADAHSPYYNEQNRASMFYAESWAIVHYLMLDPEARKRQLLSKFLAAWEASGDQVQAAQQTFGDLKKFANSMEAYVRQPSFYYAKVSTSAHSDAKNYTVRPLSPAEVSAEESLFFIQTGRRKEAVAAAAEAVASDPNLASAHEARGLIAYRDQDFQTAQKEFTRSIELSPASYVSYYYAAEARLRGSRTSYQELPEIFALFEKVLALNSQFAPAYAALSSFYSMRPETHDKALAMGKKAIELEPGNLNYATSYCYLLLNLGQTAAAKTLAARITAAARTPEEQEMASRLSDVVTSRQNASQWTSHPDAQMHQVSPAAGEKSIEVDADEGKPPASSTSASSTTTAVTPPATPDNPPRRVVNGPEYHLEGKVVAAECLPNGELKATLSINTVLMKFHAADVKSVEVTTANKQNAADRPPCAGWKGQKAKVTFHSSPPGEYDGELTAIYFF